jgi:hypothetical protein
MNNIAELVTWLIYDLLWMKKEVDDCFRVDTPLLFRDNKWICIVLICYIFMKFFNKHLYDAMWFSDWLIIIIFIKLMHTFTLSSTMFYVSCDFSMLLDGAYCCLTMYLVLLEKSGYAWSMLLNGKCFYFAFKFVYVNLCEELWLIDVEKWRKWFLVY